MATAKLKIEGMHCQACVNRVKRALEQVDGLRIQEIQIGSASIQADDIDAAITSVTKAGYPAARS
jgi:copper chaperone CopZ